MNNKDKVNCGMTLAKTVRQGCNVTLNNIAEKAFTMIIIQIKHCGNPWLYLHGTFAQLDHLKQSDRVALSVVLGHPIGLPATWGTHLDFVRGRLPRFLIGQLKVGEEPKQRTHQTEN